MSAALALPPRPPPYPAEVQSRLDAQMPPGRPPLRAVPHAGPRRAAVRSASCGGGLLDRGHLTLRQREIVIDRATARCGTEYEWGVHVAFFASARGLDAAQLRSLVHGGPGTPAGAAEDALLIRFRDACTRMRCRRRAVGRAARHFSEEAILELLMLAGFYRTVASHQRAAAADGGGRGAFAPAYIDSASIAR